MCGIVAFKGNSYDAGKVVYEGLKLLEYRGYDSAGIALISENNDLKIFKKKGRVSNSENLFLESKIKSSICIGHTRWATHGEPNDRNSHPILSFNKKFTLVHNGIIENYKELKKILEEEGYQFSTDTDTEVLVNFLESCISKSKSLEEGLTYGLSKVEGAYGIVLMDNQNPDNLYAARKGSPLAVGKFDENFILASDATPIVKYTKEVIYLDDNTLIKIEKESFKIFDFDLNVKNKNFQEVDVELQKVELGEFDSYMLKEIMEQPFSLSQTMLGRVKENKITLGGINKYVDKLLEAKRIIIIGCGTSWHAALTAEYFLEKFLNIPVEVEYASEFRYRNPIIYKSDIVFVVSQSGETADTLEATKIAKKKGATVLGIVNSVGSSIARETHEGCYLHAGPEIGVASTKAYTSQLLVFYMIGIKAAYLKENISESKYLKMIKQLNELPGKVEQVLSDISSIENIAKKIYNKDHCMFMGRGNNFPVALEGALKLKEISYIHAEGYPAAELKHGPIALIDENMPAVVICTKSNEYDKMLSNVMEIKARKAIVIGIVDPKNFHMKSNFDYSIEVPNTSKDFSPILNQIPLQLIAYFCAIYRGCDVDKPRNLAKSVTVE
jgi:glucosamine--fructose-6-phosphate aminotransferase (isomerizing)